MQIKEILLEYNLQNLLSLFQEKYKEIRDKDSSNKHETLKQFIKSIENPLKQQNKFQFIDPYMKWIIQMYVTGKLNKYEDVISKVIPSLLKYDSLKRKNKLKPEHKDINQIKDINHLLDILDEYREESTLSGKEKNKEIEENFYKTGEAILVYNDPEFKVVVPKSERASCFFGRNTRWCTVATRGKNYFNAYNKKGNLYIVIIKKENRRFQFHFNTKQFMDERDKPIFILEFRKKYPKLEELFFKIEKSKYKTGFFKDLKELTEKEIIDFLEHNVKEGLKLLKENTKYIFNNDILKILKTKVKYEDIFNFVIDVDLDTKSKRYLVYKLLDNIMSYLLTKEIKIEDLFSNKKIKELFDDLVIKKRILLEYPYFAVKFLNKAVLDEKDLEEIIKSNVTNLFLFIINLLSVLETEKVKILENFLKAARIILKVLSENQKFIDSESLLINEIFRMYSDWAKYLNPSKEDDYLMKKILEDFFKSKNYDFEKRIETIQKIETKYPNLSYFFEKFEFYLNPEKKQENK